MRSLLIILLAISVNANAATYYVATNGNNSSSGLVGFPWLTIQKAAATATAGDRVLIGPGVYNELVTNLVSGTPGNPIIFEGTRTANGWETIIDPSYSLSNTWVDASGEIGTGVWKSTNAPWPVREMHIDNQRVAFALSNGVTAGIQTVYSASGISNGIQLLTLGTSSNVTISGGTVVTWWDTVGAFWTYASNGTHNVYLRMRDGSNPNSLNVMVTRNTDNFWGLVVLSRPTISVSVAHTTWTNIHLRNGICGILYNSASCYGNAFASNKVTGGALRIYIGPRAATNYIYGNTLSTDYYGYDNPGAWIDGTNTVHKNREHLYYIAKYLLNHQESSFDNHILLSSAGNSNRVAYNELLPGIGVGISSGGNTASYPITTNTAIYGNRIRNLPSVGILLNEGTTETDIFENTISDCDISFRPHHVDDGSNRVTRIYRNKSYLPTGTNTAGEHMYFHFISTNAELYMSEWWLVNNSFSGGICGILGSSYAWYKNGFTNINIVNNILSETTYWCHGSASQWTNAWPKRFDNNWTTLPLPTYPSTNYPPWFNASNQKNSGNIWSSSVDMDFRLPPGSTAINAGTNMSPTFDGFQTLVGTTWDIGALEFSPGSSATIAPSRSGRRILFR